jgi:RecJ-like exonuclease
MNEGFIACEKCKGHGYSEFFKIDNSDLKKFKFRIEKKVCEDCKGLGKLSWLEILFGVQEWKK